MDKVAPPPDASCQSADGVPVDPALAVTEAVLGATTAALCVLDEDGRCVAATAAFARAIGRDETSLCGTVVALPAAADVRPFSPGGGRAWRLITVQRTCVDTAEEVLRAAVDVLPVAMSIKDPESRFLFVNATLVRHLGMAAADLLGRPTAEVLGPAAVGAWEQERQVLETHQTLALFEEQYAGIDGRVRDWLTTKAPMVDADGRLRGVATLSFDITDRKRLDEMQAQAREEVETASRARTRFLAAVGHELRMPLNAIIGFSEFILDQSLGPLGHSTYVEYVKDILHAGRHLLDVISDILDMARIEAGHLTLDEERVDIARTIHQIIRMMALPAQHKQLSLVADLSSDLPVLVADARRVRQILLNLVSNAVKFTPNGGGVTVSARRGEDGNLVMTVTDTGIGIAAEHLDTALAPFGRIENALSRREEGTGLGLPLTKALLETHGGRLELRSWPGQGTEVRAIFPAWRLREPLYG